MEFSTYNIVYLISNFFFLFIIRRFADIFFKKESMHKYFAVFAYLLYFAVVSLVYFKLDIPIINVIISWICIFILSFAYESTMQKRVVNTTYIFIFMLFPELVIGAATGYFHYSFFASGSYRNSMGIIVTKIITFIMALLLQNYRSTKENKNVSKSLWVSSILIPVFTLIFEGMLVSNDDLSQSMVIVSVIILFVINIMVFYLYDSLSKSYVQQSELTVLETENALYSKQCELMQSSTKELQAFRHDINNQLIALAELIGSHKYDEAEKQIDELISLTKRKIIYSTSGNTVIDGLINYKLQNALNDGIKVKTEIAVPSELHIDTTDLVAVLGNLIDNALKALQEVPIQQRKLMLKVVFSQQRLLIRISNPYVGEIVCMNGKIVTTKSDNHGYGLSNIARAVDKYKGYMDIDYLDSTFTVDIIMYI